MRARLLLTLLLFASLLALPLGGESAATLPAPAGYIDDYAGVLSAPAKSEFEALCSELHDKTKAQVFVVTVESLDGAIIDQFANDLFHRWKIGEKKTDRGVLMIFSVNDHKWRIEVGYGLESILNDAKVGDIGRDMVPHLHAARWDDGVRTGLQSVAQVIAEDAKVKLDALPVPLLTQTDSQPVVVPGHHKTADRLAEVGFTAFILLWLTTMIYALTTFFRRRKSYLASGGKGSLFSSSGSSSSSDSSDSSSDFGGGDGGDSGGGGASGDF